jgi:hypothetical protein
MVNGGVVEHHKIVQGNDGVVPDDCRRMAKRGNEDLFVLAKEHRQNHHAFAERAVGDILDLLIWGTNGAKQQRHKLA